VFINKALYHAHIKAANTWTVAWQNIEYTVNKKLEIEMNKIHNKQNKKTRSIEDGSTAKMWK
jgi:hypothetical protein